MKYLTILLSVAILLTSGIVNKGDDMFVIYTDRFIPENYDAYTRFPFILIRPSSKDDKGLLAHEKRHVKQVWKYLFLQPILYKFSKKWRLKFELEAMIAQAKEGADIEKLALDLANKYDLNISPTNAKLIIANGIINFKY